MIIIKIDGDPIPLKRPRACRRGDFINVYDSQKKTKQQVQWLIRAQCPIDPLTIPIHLHVIFYMAIPKTTSKVKRRLMLQQEISHIKKPDIDNLLKFILDCLTGILYVDDAQIVQITASKMYSEHPHTMIEELSAQTYYDKDKHEDNN